MASAKKSRRCAEVFGIGKLLLMVCQRFCKDSKTSLYDDEKRYEVELGRETIKSIQEIKGFLVILNLDKKIIVEVNVSNFATGGVLSIKCENEKWRPVVYISKSLNKAERNYEIHNKEMLVIIRHLEA